MAITKERTITRADAAFQEYGADVTITLFDKTTTQTALDEQYDEYTTKTYQTPFTFKGRIRYKPDKESIEKAGLDVEDVYFYLITLTKYFDDEGITIDAEDFIGAEISFDGKVHIVTGIKKAGLWGNDFILFYIFGDEKETNIS